MEMIDNILRRPDVTTAQDEKPHSMKGSAVLPDSQPVQFAGPDPDGEKGIESYRILFEEMFEGVGIHSADGHTLYLNPSLRNLSGQRTEAPVNDFLEKRLRPSDRPVIIENIRKASTGTATGGHECRLVGRAGVEIGTEVSFSPILWQGQPAALSLWRDVTEKNRTLDRLKASAEELELLDQVARIMTSTLDIEKVYRRFALEMGKLIEFSRIAINLVDWDQGVFVRKYLFGHADGTAYIGEVLPLEGHTTKQVVVTGKTLIRHDIQSDSRFLNDENLLKAGMRSSIVVPLICNGSAVGVLRLQSRKIAAYGQRERIILERLATQIAPAVENARLYEMAIYEKRRATEALAKLSAVLLENQKVERHLTETSHLVSMGGLIGGVAHEIANPLTSVLGFSKFLLEEPLPGPVQEDLELVYSQAERAAKMVENLLYFASLENTDGLEFDANELVRKALAIKAYDFKVHGTRVETHLAAELPSCSAEGGRVGQAILALLNHADGRGRPSGEEPEICVSTCQLGDKVRISIGDNGLPVPAEDLQSIFEASSPSEHFNRGLQLMLSQCRDFLLTKGGDLWAESRNDQGSDFILELPVEAEAGGV